MGLRAIPLTLADANKFVSQHHRHHRPVRFHLFSIGCQNDSGLCGAIIVMRPVNQSCEVYGFMAEVSRLATDGTKNTCSFLLARAAEAAFAIGYMGIQTYIRADECGASLRAAGWTFDTMTKASTWDTPKRKRVDKTEVIPRQRWRRVRSDIVRRALAKEAA